MIDKMQAALNRSFRFQVLKDGQVPRIVAVLLQNYAPSQHEKGLATFHDEVVRGFGGDAGVSPQAQGVVASINKFPAEDRPAAVEFVIAEVRKMLAAPRGFAPRG